MPFRRDIVYGPGQPTVLAQKDAMAETRVNSFLFAFSLHLLPLMTPKPLTTPKAPTLDMIGSYTYL